jgi:hypothetical protein
LVCAKIYLVILLKLYFHINRTHLLNPGDILKKEIYYNESILSVFTPFVDSRFANHISALCKDGLSLHGARYLIQIARNEIKFADFAAELYFEFIRWKYYAHLPSRLQSLFAFDKYTAALEFARENPDSRIFEIDFSGRCFIADMNFYGLIYPPKCKSITRGLIGRAGPLKLIISAGNALLTCPLR